MVQMEHLIRLNSRRFGEKKILHVNPLNFKLRCNLGYILFEWATSHTVFPHWRWCISSCGFSLTACEVHWLGVYPFFLNKCTGVHLEWKKRENWHLFINNRLVIESRSLFYSKHYKSTRSLFYKLYHCSLPVQTHRLKCVFIVICGGLGKHKKSAFCHTTIHFLHIFLAALEMQLGLFRF